jgi:hypothetical protein
VAIKEILSSGDEREDRVRISYGRDCVKLELIRDRMDWSRTRRDSTKGSLLYQLRKRDTRMRIPPRNNVVDVKSSGMLCCNQVGASKVSPHGRAAQIYTSTASLILVATFRHLARGCLMD